MPKLLSFAGWTWAALCAVLVPAAFMNEDRLAAALVRASGIHVAARYSGGEIVSTEDKGSYKVSVHRPVFDGLFGGRSSGFIQVDFVETGRFPAEIRQAVAYGEGVPGAFEIVLATAVPRAGIVSKDPRVLGAGMLGAEAGKITLRVSLKR